MKKSFTAIIAILCSLTLIGCGHKNTGVYATVRLEGHIYNLTDEDSVLIDRMIESGALPYDLESKMLYSEGGKLSDVSVTTLEDTANSIGIGTVKKSTANVNKPIICKKYTFASSDVDIFTLPQNVKFSSSDYDFSDSGYVNCGSYKVLLWVDDEIVDLLSYKSLASDYLYNPDGVTNLKTFLCEKNIISDDIDAYLTYISGASAVTDATNGYEVNVEASLGTVLDSNDDLLNAYALIFASMDLGQKYSKGKVDCYGAVMVSEDNAMVTISSK